MDAAEPNPLHPQAKLWGVCACVGCMGHAYISRLNVGGQRWGGEEAEVLPTSFSV